jgi:TetR/AcrR family transcriptional repressor of nem operon
MPFMEYVPTKKELTHQRIVDAAGRALRRDGFAGVGVADVMKQAGLSHGGFYAHFDSRETMLAEALRQASEDSAADLARRSGTRRKQGASDFRALVDSYLSDTHLRNTESGCPVAALLSEVPRQPQPLRDAVLDRLDSLVNAIRLALPDPRAQAHAGVIAATMVGALQIARALGNNAAGKTVLTAARDALLAAHDRA